MGRKKLNMVRFSVTVPEHVKTLLEQMAAQNGRSLSIEAGRLLEDALRGQGLLADLPARDVPSR